MNRKKEVFFMEIFNEILKLNNNDIVIVYDNNGDIWFSLRDVVKALEYNNIRNAITKLKISKQNIKKYKAIRGTTLMVPLNMQPHAKFINESGLYELLSISTKPLARLFMDKYFSHIMPELRKNGKYILNYHDKNKTDLIDMCKTKALTFSGTKPKLILNIVKNATVSKSIDL